MMRAALRSLLKDPGFRVSTTGKEAQLTASQLLESLDNCGITTRTAIEEIISHLACCVSNRQQMWGLFHKARTSPSFTAAWDRLLCETLGMQQASPIFYQYVTDVLFKEQVKQQYPLSESATKSSSLPLLDFQERNAIRYAAGYVVRHLCERLERGSHPLKEELVLCLADMCKDDEDSPDCSTDWTMQITRGGLKVVNNKTYHFFVAMETRIRQFFRTTEAESLSSGMKGTMMQSVARDEDVLFFWAILAAEWEEEEEQALFPMLSELWITIRGFSFARSFLEIYKQANRKTVQKSKGLRKQLIS